MSFSKSEVPCKGADPPKRNKLRLYGQVRNVAQNWFVAVDHVFYRHSAGRCWRKRRRCKQCIRHFCDANIAGKACDVEPVHNGQIHERHENDSGDYKSQGRNPDESERQRNHSSGDAESNQVREAGPRTHRDNGTSALTKKGDSCGKSGQCIFFIVNRKYSCERQPPVQTPTRDADYSSQRNK
jgi:hypothetical protein